MNMKIFRPLLLVTAGILIILLFISGWLLIRDATSTPAPVASGNDTTITATNTTAAVAAAPTLPPAQVQTLPTNTPLPTAVPTDTPVPTNTPLPTNTPTNVPPTNPPPTAVPPTNTPLPPTDTPPPPGPQAGNHRGLIATYFGLQDGRSDFTPGGKIWYEWTIDNTTAAEVPYSSIGVMPRRDGTDMKQWYQNNWGGPNTAMPVDGLSWPSWLAIPEAGDYTIRVVVCFDGFETCRDGNGTYHTLSQEIPVSIR